MVIPTLRRLPTVEDGIVGVDETYPGQKTVRYEPGSGRYFILHLTRLPSLGVVGLGAKVPPKAWLVSWFRGDTTAPGLIVMPGTILPTSRLVSAYQCTQPEGEVLAELVRYLLDLG